MEQKPSKKSGMSESGKNPLSQGKLNSKQWVIIGVGIVIAIVILVLIF